MTARARTKETALVLDEELERRVVVAARLVGVNPDEFVVRAIQAAVAKTLGQADAISQSEARGLWAVRPLPPRVLCLVADAAGLSIESIVGSQRSLPAARARAVAAYLRRHDAGLSTLDVAQVLYRKTATVRTLVGSVEQVLDTDHPRAQLLDRTRRQFKNGFSSGKQYPPLPLGSRAAKLLPGHCFTAAGVGNIPAGATGVVLNVTALGYGTNGWLTVYPNGQAVPATSTLNFDTSEYAIANTAVMPLGTGGQICVNVGTNSGTGNSQVILDVVGYQ